MPRVDSAEPRVPARIGRGPNCPNAIGRPATNIIHLLERLKPSPRKSHRKNTPFWRRRVAEPDAASYELFAPSHWAVSADRFLASLAEPTCLENRRLLWVEIGQMNPRVVSAGRGPCRARICSKKGQNPARKQPTILPTIQNVEQALHQSIAFNWELDDLCAGFLPAASRHGSVVADHCSIECERALSQQRLLAISSERELLYTSGRRNCLVRRGRRWRNPSLRAHFAYPFRQWH